MSSITGQEPYTISHFPLLYTVDGLLPRLSLSLSLSLFTVVQFWLLASILNGFLQKKLIIIRLKELKAKGFFIIKF